MAHLIPKAYSLLAFVQPSPATPTVKSVQAAMSITEILEVLRATQPFFSPRLLQYNLVQRKSPRLADLLHHLHLPVGTEDPQCK